LFSLHWSTFADRRLRRRLDLCRGFGRFDVDRNRQWLAARGLVPALERCFGFLEEK